MENTSKSEVRRLSDFTGRWRLTRSITHDSGSEARFEGFATWSQAEGGLAYREQGSMHLQGHPPMQAEQQYFWAQDFSVYFEDGRFFHQVPACGGMVHHFCDPDDYRGSYDFAAWPRFQVTWRVTGPRKSYLSASNYVPA